MLADADVSSAAATLRSTAASGHLRLCADEMCSAWKARSASASAVQHCAAVSGSAAAGAAAALAGAVRDERRAAAAHHARRLAEPVLQAAAETDAALRAAQRAEREENLDALAEAVRRARVAAAATARGASAVQEAARRAPPGCNAHSGAAATNFGEGGGVEQGAWVAAVERAKAYAAAAAAVSDSVQQRAAKILRRAWKAAVQSDERSVRVAVRGKKKPSAVALVRHATSVGVVQELLDETAEAVAGGVVAAVLLSPNAALEQSSQGDADVLAVSESISPKPSARAWPCAGSDRVSTQSWLELVSDGLSKLDTVAVFFMQLAGQQGKDGAHVMRAFWRHSGPHVDKFLKEFGAPPSPEATVWLSSSGNGATGLRGLCTSLCESMRSASHDGSSVYTLQELRDFPAQAYLRALARRASTSLRDAALESDEELTAFGLSLSDGSEECWRCTPSGAAACCNALLLLQEGAKCPAEMRADISVVIAESCKLYGQVRFASLDESDLAVPMKVIYSAVDLFCISKVLTVAPSIHGFVQSGSGALLSTVAALSQRATDLTEAHKRAAIEQVCGFVGNFGYLDTLEPGAQSKQITRDMQCFLREFERLLVLWKDALPPEDVTRLVAAVLDSAGVSIIAQICSISSATEVARLTLHRLLSRLCNAVRDVAPTPALHAAQQWVRVETIASAIGKPIKARTALPSLDSAMADALREAFRR